MAHYIDKDALVAEIKRLLAFYLKEIEGNKKDPWAMDIAKRDILQELLSFIDTLEVKEVDLEKEIENLIEKEKAFVTDNREVKYYNGDSFNHIYELEFIAKHFFELGLNAAQKGDNI